MLNSVIWPFLISLFIAVVSIPIIIRVADLKHLMDEPDQDRKFHITKTPTLGGIALFVGTIFSYCCFIDYLKLPGVTFMVPALVLLFFAGIKDDILILSPWKKLAIQFVCAALITIVGDLRLTNLWGIFGISEVSPLTGMAITLILIVALINAFNLIDGVDGLAGGLGLTACLFFGTWFNLAGSPALSILSFALAGSLFGFLLYNFRNAKIFMGDTGSMIIGFIISILAIKFVETNRSGIEQAPYFIKAAPGVAVTVVIVPLFDMTRVFFYRLSKGRNPFSADRGHIHHILLDLGFSPIQVSSTLISSAILFIVLSLILRELRSMEVVVIIIMLISILTGVATSFRNRRRKERIQYSPRPSQEKTH